MITNQFVEPNRILRPNQFGNNNREILTAETGTVINSMKLCNISNEKLRIYLYTIQHLETVTPIKCHILFNIQIDVNESVDLLSLKGSSGNPIGELFVKDGDSLVCDSSSSSQKFDLSTYFTILKEYDSLPI